MRVTIFSNSSSGMFWQVGRSRSAMSRRMDSRFVCGVCIASLVEVRQGQADRVRLIHLVPRMGPHSRAGCQGADLCRALRLATTGEQNSFIRMLRILGGCIGIAPCGGTRRNTRAGICWELPLGMLHSPNGALLRNNKSKRGSRATSLPANTERSEASAYIRSIRINLFAFMSS
jgi:hypothetical protein